MVRNLSSGAVMVKVGYIIVAVFATACSSGGVAINTATVQSPLITIASNPNLSESVMMGSSFQLTASISGTGSSTVSLAFIFPAAGTIIATPSPCIITAGTQNNHCNFTVMTAWDSSGLANGLTLPYSLAVTATNGAIINQNQLAYTELTPTIYLPAIEPGTAVIAGTGITWGNNGMVQPRFSIGTRPDGGVCPDGQGVVIDNLTGLMWLKDPSILSAGDTLDWDAALNLANELDICGYADWRMPNINELTSLINFGYENQADWLMYGSGNSANPACAGACFSNIQPAQYWSSSTIAGSTDNAFVFVIGMWNGGFYAADKPNPYAARLWTVRGTTSVPALVAKTGQTATLPLNNSPDGSDGALQEGASWPVPRFVIDNTNNCIVDKLTGLMWLKNPDQINNGNTLDWSTAINQANTGSWCGYSDWRLPNINELRSLVNFGYPVQADWLMYGSGDLANPVCDGACFNGVQAMQYWSSTSVAGNDDNAWCVHMGSGNYDSNSKNGRPDDQMPPDCSLWPVRGGN